MSVSGSDLVLILGYPRSGTSALTRVLSLCGCALPQSVLAPRELNPTGFWEPDEAIRLNHEFMLRHKTAYIAQLTRLQTDIECGDIEREEFTRKIQEFLRRCPQGRTLVMKELNTTEFLTFWLEAARRQGFSIKVVICIRNPEEVRASFVAEARRAHSNPPRAELFTVHWLARNLIAERTSRDLPRVFVDYANLMTNWRKEVDRMSDALSLDLKADEVAIEKFLTPDLHRQRRGSPESGIAEHQWSSRVFQILSLAARNRSPDTVALEEICNTFLNQEHVHRPMLDEGYQGFTSEAFFKEYHRWPVWRSGADFVQ